MTDASIQQMVSTATERAEPKAPRITGNSEEELRQAAEAFEGMFMNIVMKSMRETVPESDLFGDSQQTRMYQDLLDQEYSDMSAQVKGGGSSSNRLADIIYKQLSRTMIAGEDE